MPKNLLGLRTSVVNRTQDYKLVGSNGGNPDYTQDGVAAEGVLNEYINAGVRYVSEQVERQNSTRRFYYTANQDDAGLLIPRLRAVHRGWCNKPGEDTWTELDQLTAQEFISTQAGLATLAQGRPSAYAIIETVQTSRYTPKILDNTSHPNTDYPIVWNDILNLGTANPNELVLANANQIVLLDKILTWDNRFSTGPDVFRDCYAVLHAGDRQWGAIDFTIAVNLSAGFLRVAAGNSAVTPGALDSDADYVDVTGSGTFRLNPAYGWDTIVLTPFGTLTPSDTRAKGGMTSFLAWREELSQGNIIFNAVCDQAYNVMFECLQYQVDLERLPDSNFVVENHFEACALAACWKWAADQGNESLSAHYYQQLMLTVMEIQKDETQQRMSSMRNKSGKLEFLEC